MPIKITLTEYLELLERHPNLTAHGLKSEKLCRIEKIDYQGYRNALKEQYDAFLKCCDWLSQCPLTKKISPKSPLSYDIREKLEAPLGCYISNGAFIAAVFYLGIPYAPTYSGTNIQVAISRRRDLLSNNQKNRPPG